MDIDINLREIVDELNLSLKKQGGWKPINLIKFEKELEIKIGYYEQSIIEIIKENWEKYFPGIPFSEKQLKQKVKEYLARKKKQAMEKIKKRLIRQERYIRINRFIFSKKQVTFLITLVISLFTIPIEIKTIFSESDFGFYTGFIVLIANVALILYLNRKLSK